MENSGDVRYAAGVQPDGQCRLSNSHGLAVRLTVWNANSQSHGFAFKSHSESENLEIAKQFQKV